MVHHVRQRGSLESVAAIKKSTGKQVACSKTLIAKEGKADKVDALCKEAVAFARQRQADSKAGVITLEYSKVRLIILRLNEH